MRLPLVGAAGVLAAIVAGSSSTAAFAQDIPLAPARASGQTVQPVFEGWYRNPDGTHSLSFGYYNRNEREVLEIPIGSGNVIRPNPADRGQPTHFQPGRHWGVFAVIVPANFSVDQKVVWSLVVRGETLSVPGSLRRGWEIDALEGEVGSGNKPPVVRFDSAGRGGSGPGGIVAGPVAATVSAPLTLTAWVTDEPTGRGRATAAGRAGGGAGAGTGAAGATGATGRGRGGGSPLTLTWFKHQGPGDVTFADATPDVDRASGRAATTATFSAPGDYLLRLRVNDGSVAGAGHAQCCWTNGFVRVKVTR
jgi:hypothetical protein